MAEEISYYAIVNDFSSRRSQAACSVGSRTTTANGTRLSVPTCSGAAVRCYTRYERGDLTNNMVPISEEEADRIVARIRRVAESGA